MDKYYATEGWNSSQCDAANYLAGQPYEEDIYQGSTGAGNTLLKQTLTTYAGTNSTSASCSNAYAAGYYKPCEVVPLTTKTLQFEGTGSSNANAPWTQQSNTYDDYNSSSGLVAGKYHNQTQEVTTSSNAPTITKNMTYATTNTTVSGWTYYTVHNLTHSELVDASSHTWQCQDTAYDEGASTRPAAGWPTTVTTYSTCGTASTAIKTYTGYDANGNPVATVDGLAASNPSTFGSKGCTLSTAPVIFPTSSWSGTHYTSCTAYNATSALPTDTWNTLMQHTQTSYDATQGFLPTGVTDVNSKVTSESYSYDSSGNMTARMSEPGETSSAGYTKQGVSTSTCTDSSTLPCQEIDGNSSLYSSAVTRTFYDSLGRNVETISPGPDATHSVVTFTVYNDATHAIFKSLPFRVANRTTWLDPNGVTDDTGVTPGGTTTVFDALDSTISTTDPLSNQSTVTYGLGSVSGDTATYSLTTSVDANHHVQLTYTDALDRTRYLLDESGTNGGTLTPVSQQTRQYNALDKATSVQVTDLVPQSGQTGTSATTTVLYDDLGRMTSLNDPDRGTHTYTYDADDQTLTDVSGTRTIGTSYDLLGRTGCIQDASPLTDGSGACSSGSHPLVQNSYDSSVLGTAGTSDFPVGSLTQSVANTYYDPTDYTNKTTVTEQYQHDQRGQLIASTLQVGVPGSWGVTTTLPTYKQTQAYNTADQETTTQTTAGTLNGYTFSNAYDSTTAFVGGNPETMGDPTGHGGWMAAFAGVIFASLVAVAVGGALTFTGNFFAGPIIAIGGLGGIAGGLGPFMSYSATHNGRNFPQDPQQEENLYAQGTISALTYASIGVASAMAGVATGPGGLSAALAAATADTGVRGLVGAAIGWAGNMIINVATAQGAKSFPVNQTPPKKQVANYLPKSGVSSQSVSRSNPVPGTGAKSNSASGSSGSLSRYYTVASGDTLSGISLSYYGTFFQWQRIYQANTGVIGSNPNLIYSGERLLIPR